MFRLAVPRLRLAWLAAIVALMGAGWPRVETRAWSRPDASVRPQTFDAATLLGTVPAILVPQFEPGLRLVTLIASDIDADGDLDLVASDGSLDLLVWINDGTGHLTRRYARQPGGWSEDARTVRNDADQTTWSAVGSSNASLGPGRLWSLALTVDGLRASLDSPPLDSLLARSQSPRAPPASLPSI